MHPLLTELGDIAGSPRVIPSNIFSEAVTEAESLHYFQRIKEVELERWLTLTPSESSDFLSASTDSETEEHSDLIESERSPMPKALTVKWC